MKAKHWLLAVLALALSPANAQAQVAQNPPLMGAVHFNAEPGAMRLTRMADPIYSGAVDREYGYGGEQQAQFDNVIDPSAFQGSINEVVPPPRKQPPYIWYQSADGGYYDGSGHTGEHVWANKLYLYGGKFSDGSPVPEEPITQFNSMGHAYKSAQTNTSIFWDH